MTGLNQAIERMTERICFILDQNVHSIWLYGSAVLDDFQLGWSDIDLLVLTCSAITEDQARQLVGLRQTMLESEPDNPYYRSFEGIIAARDEYLTGSFTRLVYWGTSGQRITDHWQQDVFSSFELAKYGRSVCGAKDRGIFAEPSAAELREAVKQHYEAIRKYAVQTDEKLFSCGWLLDIARCIYTLRYNDIIAKTRAGLWALSEHIFSDDTPLRRTLEIRQHPAAYKGREDVKQWLKGLGPVVQRYADVLERELYVSDPCGMFSLPFWKTRQTVLPPGVTVLREDQFHRAQCGGTDTPYFKLVHRLRQIDCPELQSPFAIVQCSDEDLAEHIAECYSEEGITADELRACRKRPVFDPDLRLSVADMTNGRIVASGIAEIDPCIREGTLEWIQVSPDYRRQGLGKYVVCELLRRLSGKAGFVTVSGKMNHPDNPLALYRLCGFSDCVVWHVVRKEDGPSLP